MAAGLAAAAFGAIEAVLLKKALNRFTAGKYTAAVALTLIKLLLYASAIPVLVFVFPSHIIECVIGYAVGLPASVTFCFIFNTIKNAEKASSGDDQNESGNNN